MKLIRRHPHVFGDATANTAEDVKNAGTKSKPREGRQGDWFRAGRCLTPCLVPARPCRSPKAFEESGRYPIRSPDVNGVVDKVREEEAELAEARESLDRIRWKHEMGDFLFTVVNLARFLNVIRSRHCERRIRGFATVSDTLKSD